MNRWHWLIVLVLLFGGSSANAATGGTASPLVTIHYFHADGCPHCAQASAFLKRYAGDARITIREYEARNNAANRERFIKVANALGVQDGGVPFILIGDWAVMGYLDDRRTGSAIAIQVAHCLDSACPDNVAAILAGVPPPTPIRFTRAGAGLPETVTLPLIGEISTAALSLPALTVVLGAIDGFNPCAMWALVFLLSLLMGTKDRRRMWILGLTFLFGSGLVYFLIMAAWLNVLLVIGYSLWIRAAVGVIALGAAAYYLYDFASNPDAACEVSHSGGRQQMLARLRRFALEERLWPAMAGVLLLAIAVNMIELICSAGIPAIYTHLLTLTPMPRWQYYGYLLLYNLVFMLDDIAMFAVAMATLKMTGLGARYARASRLIGGVVLAVIGLMLLFRPQWLSFSG